MHSIHFLLPQNGQTSLVCAAISGHGNVVEKLLAAGANHDLQNSVRNLVTKMMLVFVQNAFAPNK